MQNSYIIDAFLSGLVGMILIYLYFDTRARIAELSEIISVHALKVALPTMLTRSLLISIPLMGFYVFLLWRFHGFMVHAAASGAGGLGLLAMMLAAGLPLIWLNVILICVSHSRYTTRQHNTGGNTAPANPAGASQSGIGQSGVTQ